MHFRVFQYSLPTAPELPDLRYMDDIVVWGDPATLSHVRLVAEEALAAIGRRLKHGGEWNRVRLGRQARARLRRRSAGAPSSDGADA